MAIALAEASDETALELLLRDSTFRELSAAQPFNVFDAMGMVRAEIRHSHFLAHLIDPNESHGLGDRFLRTFLASVCGSHASFRTADVLLARFDDIAVYRERFSIDVLIVAPSLGLVCAIENKIGSGEHSDQLSRYRAVVDREFASFPHRVFVYLTPDGDAPSDRAYTAVGYNAVVEAVEELIATSGVGSELGLVLRHYVTMIRNRVMTDVRIVDLCRALYQRHRRAIDLIVQFAIVDRDEAVATIVSEHAREAWKALGFVEDASTDRTLRFADPVLDGIDDQLTGVSTTSRRLLLYEIGIRKDKVELVARLGPGDAGARTRFHAALDTAPLRHGKLYDSWYRVYSVALVPPAVYSQFDANDVETVAAFAAAITAGIEAFATTTAVVIRERLVLVTTSTGLSAGD